MKITIAVLVLCSLQSSLVLAKTVEDVIEDFLPIMGVVHDELAAQVNDKYWKAMNEVNDFEKLAGKYERKINEQWARVSDKMIEQTVSIVTETGMTDRPDEIQHCYEQADTDFWKFYNKERSVVEVLIATVVSEAESLREWATNTRDKQNNVHDSIDAGITHCKDQAATAVDMQLCLINHYTLSKTAVQDALETIQSGMIEVSDTIGIEVALTDRAVSIIAQRIQTVHDPVIDGFRTCCIAASQTSH